MRRFIGSRCPNRFSASLLLITATWALEASSRCVNERPGSISPPSIFGQSAFRPRIPIFRVLVVLATPVAPDPERLRAERRQHIRDALVEAADQGTDHHDDRDA